MVSLQPCCLSSVQALIVLWLLNDADEGMIWMYDDYEPLKARKYHPTAKLDSKTPSRVPK